MPRTKKAPSPAHTHVCAAPDCAVAFTPTRSTARYHSATCKKRAARARKAAEVAAEIDRQAETEDNAGTADAEHGLVKATRLELEKADALDTVDGQIALQLARKLTDPTLAGFAGIAKELRAILRDATGARPGPAADAGESPTPEPEDDEVTRARRAREEARQAAGRT